MPSDLPRVELIRLARETVGQLRQEGVIAWVWFKWTCPGCGTRNTLEMPGVLAERSNCIQCGQETVIEKGGFALAIGNIGIGPTGSSIPS
jgi:hypothetical protein